MQKHWLIKQAPLQSSWTTLQDELKVSPLMAKLLAQRDLTTRETIRSFFNPSLDQLHDPFLMLHLSEAVDRLQDAISNGERIFLFGDYDVDGTTAVSLVYEVLSTFAEVDFYIPDRYEEGYGVSYQGIDKAIEWGAGLMITLDCGIKDVDKVNYAQERGLDVIVCDHHTPGEVVPNTWVLDPKQENCTYPYKELCGAGVGFKLLQGWFQRYQDDDSLLYAQLDLVAIAIGADIVPVTGENRVLCKLGLAALNVKPRVGIEVLVKMGNRDFPLSLSNVVFTVAPRINAAGRLASGKRAVELLLAKDLKRAQEIGAEIDAYNMERRFLDQQITEEALALIDSDVDFEGQKSTLVFSPDWHKGVVGIVASRLIERHYRPTIVLTESKGKATGSARSVAGFNLYDAIAACSEHLEQFGGHHHAAGLTLAVENIPAFKAQFEAIVQERIATHQEIETIEVDAEIELKELFVAGESMYQIPRIYDMLEQMEPFGPGNDKPVFCLRAVYASDYKLLKGEHLKLQLTDESGKINLSAIGFNMKEKEDLVVPGMAFDCLVTLDKNTWNGKSTLQLQFRDLIPS